MIVEVKQGKLRGTECKSVLTGKTYYGFFGIRYAKTPKGDLRFRPPEPVESWPDNEVYDATYERDVCTQVYFRNRQLTGSEDCLFVNISTPEPPAEIKIPKAVMVFLHGGAFAAGSAYKYSADFLINKDVVLVTLSYRLHVLGFLNLGLPDCPGNVGLKDQLLALKWIKANIQQFGGDPNNITLFGVNSGATSIHYHLMSPHSKGLFQRVAMHSGSAFSPWGFTANPKEMAFEIGRNLGFKGESREELLEFLKKIPYRELTTAADQMLKILAQRYKGRCNVLAFTPSVEEIKEGAFIPDHPEKLLQNVARMPLIYGVTTNEGIPMFKISCENITEVLQEDLSLIIKNNFKIDPVLLPEITAKVKEYYFKGDAINKGNLLDLFTDVMLYRFYESIDFILASSEYPVYVFEFQHDGELNLFKKIVLKNTDPPVKGASHAEDTAYLFYDKNEPCPPKFTADDCKVIEHMTTMWSNYAKTGVPSDNESRVSWRSSTKGKPCNLLIDTELKLIEGKVYGERYQFLKNLLGPVATPF